jgi:hypothetical protein
MKRAITAVVVVTAYAWMSAGVAPFTVLSYVIVAIPTATMVVLYLAMGGLSPGHADIKAHYRRRADGASPSTVAPWIAVLVVAATLETVGLLLGGRSPSVPTLSTAVDHLLEARWERCVMCAAWLLVGGMPLLRLRQSIQGRDS